MTDIETIKEQIAAHNRRLHKLRLQKATYGLAANPSIELEIEDIEAELKKLQAEWPRLEAGPADSASAAPSGAAKYNLTAPGAQVGVIGDQVTIRGGIHFHSGSAPPPSSAESAGRAGGDYAQGRVQALLADIFTEDELRDFCLYEAAFQPVYDELKESDRKADILRQILNHARKKGLFDDLLAWAKEANAERYAAGGRMKCNSKHDPGRTHRVVFTSDQIC